MTVTRCGLALFSFLFVLNSSAQETTEARFKITGFISDIKDEPIDGIKIKVFSNGECLLKTKPANDGSYTIDFPLRDNAKYEIHYMGTRYIHKRLMVDLNGFNQDDFEIEDIYPLFETLDIVMVRCKKCSIVYSIVAKFHFNAKKGTLMLDQKHANEQRERLRKCIEPCL